MEHINLEEIVKSFRPATDLQLGYGWKPVYQWNGYNVYLVYRKLMVQGIRNRILAGFYMDGTVIPNGASSSASGNFMMCVRGTNGNIPSIIGINSLGVHQSITDYVYDPATNTGYSLCDNVVLYKFANGECTRVYSTEGKEYMAPLDLFFEEFNTTAGFEPGIEPSLLIDGDIPFSKR